MRIDGRGGGIPNRRATCVWQVTEKIVIEIVHIWWCSDIARC